MDLTCDNMKKLLPFVIERVYALISMCRWYFNVKFQHYRPNVANYSGSRVTCFTSVIAINVIKYLDLYSECVQRFSREITVWLQFLVFIKGYYLFQALCDSCTPSWNSPKLSRENFFWKSSLAVSEVDRCCEFW